MRIISHNKSYEVFKKFDWEYTINVRKERYKKNNYNVSKYHREDDTQFFSVVHNYKIEKTTNFPNQTQLQMCENVALINRNVCSYMTKSTFPSTRKLQFSTYL